MNKKLSFDISLPLNYRHDDFLSFHRRDQQMIAERIDGRLLSKGIVWKGKPALLEINVETDTANIRLHIDDTLNNENADDHNEFQLVIERMLGIQQTISEFEHRFKSHSILGPFIFKNPGLRVAVTATPFEALSWAITGQQISVNAAISIRRKFIQLVAIKHSSGLWCYPDEHLVSQLDEKNLREAGFSQAKAHTLITLSRYLIEQKISLNTFIPTPDLIDKLSTELLALRGLGPWSVNYALLRGFGWLDGSLHGDVVVRRNLQTLLGASEKISEKETQQWLLEFSPWRALVAAHLWMMKKRPN